MNRIAACLVALALLAGCSTIAEAPNDARLAASCRAYAATLTGLAQFKPDMSPGQIKIVDNAVAVVGPICRRGEQITDIPSALVVVAGALSNLATVERDVKR